MHLLGIDLAWQSPPEKADRNTTAMAFGAFDEDTLVLDRVIPDATYNEYILEHIEKELNNEDLRGIAIDAPLIIPSSVKRMRECEREVSRAYGHLGAGCHPTNSTEYMKARSPRISKYLERKGFTHLGKNSDRWQIECYPHPALIEIFELDRRLPYKKGKVDEKRQGQLRLARLLQGLKKGSPIRLEIPEAIEDQVALNEEAIHALKGQALKRNEDALDAIVCLLIAAFYAREGLDGRIFGDSEKGYIYVPRGEKARV